MTDQTSTSPITIEKKKGYIMHASTGCSCCAYSNFIVGIYSQASDAENQALEFHRNKRLSSQYSDRGIYIIQEIEYEALSDGRIIMDKYVFEDDCIHEEAEIAQSLRSFGERIYQIGS